MIVGFQNLGIDFREEFIVSSDKIMTTDLVKRVIRDKFKLSITQFQATQAMIACNTKADIHQIKDAMKEKSFTSIPAREFSLEKFCIWMMRNIKLFHKVGQDKFNLPSLSLKKNE